MKVEKSKPHNEQEELNKLINRGVSITHCTQRHFVHREGQGELDSMFETFKDYHNWKADIRNFLLDIGFENEADFFYEGDSVPLFTSGTKYSDVESPQWQELLQAIRKETKEKLTFLRSFTKEFTERKPEKQKADLTQKNIEKIEVVQPRHEGNKFLIVINDNYKAPLRVDRAKPSWELLYQVAQDIPVDEQGHKTTVDYFNSNKRCQLYTKTGYSITKILTREAGYILPTIKIKIITEKAYQQRANKHKGAA